MGYSFSEDTGDGTKVTFAFAFIGPDNGYFDDADIKVEVDSVDTAFTLTGPTQVTLAVAPAIGAKVRVLRKPPTDAPYTDFQRGNSFGKLNINRSFQQQLYLSHRTMDGFKEPGYYEKQDKSMGNYQIKDVQDGTEPQDCITIKQVQDVLSDNEQNKIDAETAATEAEASAAAALISENNAGTSATNASTSESNAGTSESNANTSANLAEAYMDAALISKDAANNSAAEAATSRDTTEGYRDEALISKNSAETAATNAGTSESNASDSADAANFSKINAESAATSSYNYSRDSYDYMTAGSGFATNASNSATAASNSAIAASDSADAAAVSATYSEDFIEHSESPMIISGGELSHGTNALTLKVSALEAYLRASDSESGHLTKITLAEQDNITIPLDNVTYFVSLNYNAGTPVLSLNTSQPYDVDKRNIPLGRVSKDTIENVVHFLGAGYRLNDGMQKTQKALYIKDGLTLAKGANIAYSGTNNFTMTEGISFAGINEFILPAFDSAVTTFKPVYRDGAGSYTVGTARKTIDYAHYDDGSGVLGTVPNNRYACFWVYKHIDDGGIYVMYGYAKGSLIEAETSSEPTRPDHITAFGLLVGKIITPYNGGSFTEVFMATDTQFAGHLVSDHNQLSSLQGGALDEYYHITIAEHTGVLELTSSGDTALHYHSSDRSRANHTGTQLASTISDFDSTVEANSAVSANTAKETNVDTNITVAASATQIMILSSDGTDAVISSANTNSAGILTNTLFNKIEAAAASYTEPWV